jgi:UDP-N-acetyl-2-amino-2-deoxyglucuronate dehydrogenase
MKNFALTGAAGYVAPRHLKSIKDTGNQLLAAIDPFDSVGILDSFFPDCSFFTEYERFDRHLEKLKRKTEEERIHYVSICSPNHLHDAHIRTALRIGADALCEKPLVLNPWNLDALAELEAETGRRVWTVLQLRVYPTLVALREQLNSESNIVKHKVVLTYVTSRGNWYLRSWKGELEKSGGVTTNIGVHFFDMLTWMFGEVEHMEIHVSDEQTCSGNFELERASVQWFLSIDNRHIPANPRSEGQRTYRSITIDDDEIEFSSGFTDLHTEIYRRTMAGFGFGLEDARRSIELVQLIRTASPSGVQKHSHPFLR